LCRQIKKAGLYHAKKYRFFIHIGLLKKFIIFNRVKKINKEKFFYTNNFIKFVLNLNITGYA
tara:strand:- start:363 stop:548 length:186 start_codon:yes stop_codon:yes gene_type:complete